MYLMLMTRPDIAFPIQWLSRQLGSPFIEYLTQAKGTLRYLKGSKDLAITYIAKGKGKEAIGDLTTPIAYSNSNFIGDLSSKLTYSYLIKLVGAPIS